MNVKRIFPAFAILFTAACMLAAQETGPFFHRLSWQPVEYASGYEVTVEILTASNEWVEQFRKTGGAETFIDCPLVIGKYRFRVSAFDLLGRPGPATAWIYFELRTREPEQSGEAAPAGAGSESSPRPEGAGPEEAAAPPRMDFSREDETSLFALDLLYTPLITLPFSDFNEIYSTAPFQPIGFTMRFTYHPLGNATWGLGAAGSWNFLTTEIHSRSRYTHIAGGRLFAVWSIQPPEKNVNIRIYAGAGFTYISSRFDFNGGLDVRNQNTWNPQASIGVSFQSRLAGPLFFDTGIEYFHIFSSDNLMLNYLRPTIGIGWRL